MDKMEVTVIRSIHEEMANMQYMHTPVPCLHGS